MPAAELERLLEEERERGTFPSWQAAVAEGGVVRFAAARGLAVVEPESIPADIDTLYDLASLTKPLVTALLALELAESGVLPLDIPVSRLLPEMDEGAKREVTVLDLLVHRSGFPAWRPLYLDGGRSFPRLWRRAAREPLENEPGRVVRYSDLGFFVLAAALEVASGTDFATLAGRLIAGREGLGFRPGRELRRRIAATERGNEHERVLAGAEPGDPRFRRTIIWGEVHDANAWAGGGVCPHAGLFGNVHGVLDLASEYLDGSRRLGRAALALSRANLTPGDPSPRTAAFELAAGEGSAAHGALPDNAVGHTGFTGTSVWIEPERARIYVLLTNRVHPEVRNVTMNAVRRRFHYAAREL